MTEPEKTTKIGPCPECSSTSADDVFWSDRAGWAECHACGAEWDASTVHPLVLAERARIRREVDPLVSALTAACKLIEKQQGRPVWKRGRNALARYAAVIGDDHHG